MENIWTVMRDVVAGNRLRLIDGGSDGQDIDVSVADLVAESESIAGGLHARGLEPGDRVALFAWTSIEFVAAVLAVWRAGGIVVTLPTPLFGPDGVWSAQVLGIARVSEPKFLLAQSNDIPIRGIPTVPLRELEPASIDYAGPDSADPALIQSTSGSTGRPRGVLLRHAALVAQNQIVGERVPPTDDPRRLSSLAWLPMFHDLGFINYLVNPLARGVTLALMRTSTFVRDPVRWLIEMSKGKVARSAAPAFGYAVAARALHRMSSPPDLDLSGWRHAGCGGEFVDPNTLLRFAEVTERFGFDPNALAPGYGLAEATCVVSVPPVGSGLRIDHLDRSELSRGRAVPVPRGGEGVADIASVGLALPRIDVSVIDAEGRSLPDREIGEIVVTGPCLMDGYVGHEDGPAPFLDGRLRTGDLGYVVDREIFITGRLKDVVIIGGRNFNPEDIERVAQRVEGVKPGRCVAFSLLNDGRERLIVVTETKRPLDPHEVARDVKRVVWREVGITVSDVMVVEDAVVPKTSSGKLRRSSAREMYEEGSLHDREGVGSG